MRIAQLTAGTGGFYCGNCIRDTTLISALRARGHDALIVPMYLPILAEETAAETDAPVFFGGVNCYLQQKLGIFRRTPRWIDRLFDASWLLRLAGSQAHLTRARDLGEMTVSMLGGEDGNQHKELERLCTWLARDFRPEVINLSNVLLVGMAPALRRATGARVVCTLHGEDSFLDSLPEPWRAEAWELVGRHAAGLDGMVAVSDYYRGVMVERLKLEPSRIHVVHNGIRIHRRLASLAARNAANPPKPAWGYLARMTHGKGLTTLVDAFIELKQRPSARDLELHIGGSMTQADRPYVESLKTKLRKAGLDEHVRWFPNLEPDAKWEFLAGLRIFSVPATYGEAFGLYILEAVAAGVPVVQPRHGAFPELLERLGHDVLCEPDDPVSLADAAETLLLDAERARLLGERGRGIVHRHFSDVAMAERMERFYLGVLSGVPSMPVSAAEESTRAVMHAT
jgi:glycosyltransferase involved in cell wall biosynthesis